ncbi:hypothetical protein [Halomonas denitrificans]|nr:hypothetical protein [Halomonas denitrificans]
MRLLPAVALAALVGCAGTPQRATDPSQPGPDIVAERLIGRYVGQSPGREALPVALTIRRQSVPGVVPVIIELAQQAAGEAARRFAVSIAPTAVPFRVEGVFAPLGADDAAVGDCPLTGTIRDDGVVLTTDATTCRFGSGDADVGLVKEIAFDGERLLIADRVVAADGASRGDDRVIEFLPVHRYRGWAGRRDDGGDAWRRAEDVALTSDGRSAALLDAAGMPLGVEVELAPYWPGADGAVLLRLRAFDAETGAPIGQAWADTGARALGLAVEDFQVGLERVGR